MHGVRCMPPCSGACPKSYGTNVARLAGLPASVVSRAAHMSATTVSEPGGFEFAVCSHARVQTGTK
eukprot:756079-Pelagomonas_calceolata.AAC.5